MPKQDSKIQQQQVQTCLLRVNIHCEGCKHKVKKTLKKVEGVYKVNIDAEQGKVSVSGNVDPATLINKLEKSGKHAEMWGPPQKGPISFNQLNNNNNNNFHIGKNDKGFKEQKNKGGGGVHQLPQHLNNKNGSKDAKIVGKNQNSVRFNLPEEEYDDDEDDYSDDFDEDEEDGDFDDGSDDGGGYAHHPPGGKGAHLAAHHHHPKSNKPTPPKVKKGKNGDKDKSGGDVKKKSGGGINMFIKGMLGKASGKNGKVGDGHHKEGNENGSGKKKDKKDGFVHEHGKNNGGKSKESWSKKAGEKFDNGGHKNKESNNKKQAFNEMNLNHRGGGGGGAGGGGGMGDFQGLPKTMNGGHLQGGGGGGGQGNPYNQQQMAMMMMMMNQQNANRPEAYHPLGYAAAAKPPPAAMSYGQPPPHAMGYYGQQQPQPAMNYGQPPPPMVNDQYSHMFSDENTDSCSIM